MEGDAEIRSIAIAVDTVAVIAIRPDLRMPRGIENHSTITDLVRLRSWSNV